MNFPPLLKKKKNRKVQRRIKRGVGTTHRYKDAPSSKERAAFDVGAVLEANPENAAAGAFTLLLLGEGTNSGDELSARAPIATKAIAVAA